MDRNAILDAMYEKAEFLRTTKYGNREKAGILICDILTDEQTGQWDSSMRPYGVLFHQAAKIDGVYEGNGFSFDAVGHAKLAYSRRTGLNSSANFWEVVGTESYWKGAVISSDKKCICVFSGFEGCDDVEIAKAGIEVYEASLA